MHYWLVMNPNGFERIILARTAIEAVVFVAKNYDKSFYDIKLYTAIKQTII